MTDYQAIFQNSPVGLFQSSPTGQYLTVNQALAELYGYDSPTQLHTELTNIGRQLYVDSARGAEFAHACAQTGSVRNFESQVFRRDGSIIWIAESAHRVYNEAGQLAYYEGVVQDITAQKALSQASQQRSERLQTAAEVARAASSILDTPSLIERSVNLIKEQFDYYYVGMFLVEAEWAVLKAGTGEAGQRQLDRGHRLKLGGGSMIGWSVEHRQAKIALDVGAEAVHFKNPDLPHTRSEMALPLMSRDEVMGALTIQSVQAQAFSDEDIMLLQTMADQLANAIKNAQLFEHAALAQQNAEARLAESEALQQLSRSLAATLDLTEIGTIFGQGCLNQLKQAHILVALLDPPNLPQAISGVGVSAEQLTQWQTSLTSQPARSLALARMMKTGQPAELDSPMASLTGSDYSAWPEPVAQARLLPISLRQQLIGLIEFGFPSAQPPWPKSLHWLLQAFIDQLALALDNAKRYQASQRARYRADLLKKITTRVRAETNVEPILQTAVAEISQALGGQAAFITLKE
ncbi:GAF domain-containing protein [Anaerolineales bacterium HSG24]|nr:GAF domain-containing protein [Anaerolineales bacterium HSG24]